MRVVSERWTGAWGLIRRETSRRVGADAPWVGDMAAPVAAGLAMPPRYTCGPVLHKALAGELPVAHGSAPISSGFGHATLFRICPTEGASNGRLPEGP